MPAERPGLAALPTLDVETSLTRRLSELHLAEAKGMPETLKGCRHIDLDRPFGIERVVLISNDVELEKRVISGQVTIAVDRVEEAHAIDRCAFGRDAVGRKVGCTSQLECLEDVGRHHHIIDEGGSPLVMV